MRALPYLACLILLFVEGDGPDWITYLWWLVIGLMLLDIAVHVRGFFGPVQRPTA